MSHVALQHNVFYSHVYVPVTVTSLLSWSQGTNTEKA